MGKLVPSEQVIREYDLARLAHFIREKHRVNIIGGRAHGASLFNQNSNKDRHG